MSSASFSSSPTQDLLKAASGFVMVINFGSMIGSPCFSSAPVRLLMSVRKIVCRGSSNPSIEYRSEMGTVGSSTGNPGRAP